MLAHALVVGDTFCLGRTRFFACESQHDEYCQEWQNVVEVGWQADVCKQCNAVAVDIQLIVQNGNYNELLPTFANYQSSLMLILMSV